jgi:hypothetical protein
VTSNLNSIFEASIYITSMSELKCYLNLESSCEA